MQSHSAFPSPRLRQSSAERNSLCLVNLRDGNVEEKMSPAEAASDKVVSGKRQRFQFRRCTIPLNVTRVHSHLCFKLSTCDAIARGGLMLEQVSE